jgi:rubredoxin
MPKEPPPYISPIAPEDKTPRVGLCPKCHFAQSDMTDYDAETMTFKCRRCGFKYSQLKASPHDYVEPKDKTEFKKKPKSRKHFPIKKVIGLSLAAIIIGALLWYAPNIISYFQNSSPQSSDASYTSLTLRHGMNYSTTLEFGDTEYSFSYYYGLGLQVSTFIEGSKSYSAHKGDTYRDFGIELKVSNVASDYISNYIVILVKPTVQNYMASLYYTRVNITLNEAKSVNISSGLVNETREYGFLYTQVMHPSFYEPQLTIHIETQEKTYDVSASGSALWSSDIKDFNIETRVFKIESQYMVIYVKPLY